MLPTEKKTKESKKIKMSGKNLPENLKALVEKVDGVESNFSQLYLDLASVLRNTQSTFLRKMKEKKIGLMHLSLVPVYQSRKPSAGILYPTALLV